jgi:hypothetical protein
MCTLTTMPCHSANAHSCHGAPSCRSTLAPALEHGMAGPLAVSPMASLLVVISLSLYGLSYVSYQEMLVREMEGGGCMRGWVDGPSYTLLSCPTAS